MYLNPEEISNALYISGKILKHETTHSFYDRLPVEDKRVMFEALGKEKDLILSAWKMSDGNDHNPYWENTIFQINNSIEDASNSLVANLILKKVGLNADEQLLLSDFIDKSFDLKNVFEQINALLEKEGYKKMKLNVEETFTVHEHVAMVGENSGELESKNPILQAFIDGTNNMTLIYKPDAVSSQNVFLKEKTPQEILAEAEKKAEHLGIENVMPETGPINITQAEDVAREADNYDDFIATLKGGEEAVQPFYEEDKPTTVTNKYYDDVVKSISADGYASLEDFYQKNKKVKPQRAKSIKKAVDSIVSKGRFTEPQITEMLTPEKINVEKVRSIATSRIQLSPELEAKKQEIDQYNYLVHEAEMNVKDHPGKKLQQYISTKEGQFKDFENPSSAKTDAERERIMKRNKEISLVAQDAFDLFPEYKGRYEDPDAIREAIADYEQSKNRLAELKQERAAVKRQFYSERNAYWAEERDRYAINNIVTKEEYLKTINEVEKIIRKEGRNRKQKVEDIRDYFYLTDKEVRDVLGNEDYRLMSDKQFDGYLEKLKDKFFEIRQHSEAVAEVERTIAEKELKLTENLQESMGLSTDLKKISTDDLEKLNQLLGFFEKGDVFLGVREIETLAKNTDLPYVKTRRQILEEVILKRYPNLTMSQIKTITKGKIDEFRSATSLAQQNAFYEVMVNDAYQMKVEAELKFADIEKKTQELVKKARVSRNRRIIDRLIPTDDLVVQYLEEENVDMKSKLAATMTAQELELAHYIRNTYADMRDYLVKKDMLKRVRENYYTHKSRGFLEAWFKGDYRDVVPSVNGETKERKVNFIKSLFRAIKETVWDVHKMEESTFKILDEKTGAILPLEKFFKYSMARSGKLIPTKNVANAFLAYTKTFETKKALDSYIPKMEAVARALTPMETTDKGLVMDETLLNFVKKWINTQKGRPASLGVINAGDTVDTLIRSGVAFTRFLDLAFRFGAQVMAPIGEQSATFINVGTKKYATGVARMVTPKGRKIIKKYEEFLGKSFWNKMVDASKDVGSKLGETVYGFYSVANRGGNIIHLLSAMTPEEFKTGEISTQRLAEIRNEIGRWRADDSLKSVYGATSVGAMFREHKGWAIPILTQTISNVATLSEMLKNKEFKNAAKSKEFSELLRAIIVTTILVLTANAVYQSLKNKKDRNFIEELEYRALNEAFSFLSALDPSTLGSAPRLISWLADFSKSLSTIVVSLSTGARDAKGKIQGLTKLEQSVIPKILRSSSTDPKTKAKNDIKEAYLAGDGKKTGKLIREAIAKGYIKKENLNAYKTGLRKEKRIAGLFTTHQEQKWLDRLEKAQSLDDKVLVLQEMKNSMSPEKFTSFLKKGRSTVTSLATGDELHILISDQLKDAYLKSKSAK